MKVPVAARFDPEDYRHQTNETYAVTFNGYGGQPVKGWLLIPHQRAELLPFLVENIGYGAGRGFPKTYRGENNGQY
jgi:cephalosporin-C deacetylase